MYDLTIMKQIAQEAIDQMPPVSRFNEEDATLILQYKEALLSWGPELVISFYDTIFEHEATAAIYRDGERPMREETLTDYWIKTVNGPIDLDYFGWMAMIGLIHVVRKVENPMMLAMSSFVTDFVEKKIFQEPSINPENAQKVIRAFRKYTSTTSAIITYGYDSSRVSALYEIIGMEESLLQRLTQQTVEGSLGKAGYIMSEKKEMVSS